MSKKEENIKKFIWAIRNKKKIRLEFIAQLDRQIKIRKCAPYDFGPYQTYDDEHSRYHVYDYDSYGGAHTLTVLEEQVLDVEILRESFNPKDIIVWFPFIKNRWHIKRDWGDFS